MAALPPVPLEETIDNMLGVRVFVIDGGQGRNPRPLALGGQNARTERQRRRGSSQKGSSCAKAHAGLVEGLPGI